MRISIVTPTYQSRQFLQHTIESVLLSARLANIDLEYIVIDGGSTDGTNELLQSYSPYLAYWCSEPDQGQYDAINKGFARATGDILAWLNASDVYFPHTLATVHEIFSQFPSVQWISSLHKTCIRENGAFDSLSETQGFSASHFLRGLHGGPNNSNFLQQESCFWRHGLWQAIGAKLDLRWRFAADFWLWGQFFQHARCTGVEAPLAAFRFHGEQRSNDARYLNEVCQILAELQTTPKNHFVRGVQNLMRQWVPAPSGIGGTTRWKLDIHADDAYLDLLNMWAWLTSEAKWKGSTLSYLPIAALKFAARGFRPLPSQ